MITGKFQLIRQAAIVIAERALRGEQQWHSECSQRETEARVVGQTEAVREARSDKDLASLGVEQASRRLARTATYARRKWAQRESCRGAGAR